MPEDQKLQFFKLMKQYQSAETLLNSLILNHHPNKGLTIDDPEIIKQSSIVKETKVALSEWCIINESHIATLLERSIQ